jgi:hypothetical protein
MDKPKKKRGHYKPKTMSEKALAANKGNAKKGGRPKGSVSEETRMKQEMRRMLTKVVHQRFGELVRAQVDLASGLCVEETDTKVNADGELETKRRVYRRPPSNEALKYLLDQSVGKAKESLDVNLTDGRRVSIADLEMASSGKIDEVVAALSVRDDEEEDETEQDDDE